MTMTIEQADLELQRLRETSERINASLLELELDPNRELLEKSALRGASAERWAAASAALTQLWQWQALLDALLARATTLRGGRRLPTSEQLAMLSRLLEGPSVEFTAESVPLAERDLFGNSPATRPCTADELLARMSATFEAVKDSLVEVGRAWDTYLPRLTAAQATLTTSTELVHGLDDRAAVELDASRDELATLLDRLAHDPLSVNAEAVDRFEALLERRRADAGALAELSRDIDRRLADAHELLDQLIGAQRACQSAHADALARISNPAVPVPPAVGPEVAAALADIEQLARAGAWREARDALGGWTGQVRRLIEQADRTRLENRAPIDTRHQLRGLLDAYQAKARRLGLIEDATLADLHAQAREALFTAPTDVERAGELVRRYQRALPGAPAHDEVSL